MSYGWATVFTLAAWFAGLVIDANVRVGDLGLRTVLPVIVMGCSVLCSPAAFPFLLRCDMFPDRR